MSKSGGRSEYVRAQLAENVDLGGGNFVLRFRDCEFLKSARAGQFVMLRAEDWGSDPLLPRAFSLLSVSPDGVADILIKAAGKASAMLQQALPGARFGLLGPLGNGFSDPSGSRPTWLVAGGVGLAPLLMVANRAMTLGYADQLTMFYGGRTQHDLVLADEIKSTGVRIVHATEDGSVGHRGFVTLPLIHRLQEGAKPHLPSEQPVIFACGPDPMLFAVAKIAKARSLECYLSLEGEMACGIGACLVCAVPCNGPKPYQYACVSGPVFSLDVLRGYGESEVL